MSLLIIRLNPHLEWEASSPNSIHFQSLTSPWFAKVNQKHASWPWDCFSPRASNDFVIRIWSCYEGLFSCTRLHVYTTKTTHGAQFKPRKQNISRKYLIIRGHHFAHYSNSDKGRLCPSLMFIMIPPFWLRSITLPLEKLHVYIHKKPARGPRTWPVQKLIL